jgi:hypothetical protein
VRKRKRNNLEEKKRNEKEKKRREIKMIIIKSKQEQIGIKKKLKMRKIIKLFT